MGQEQVLGVTKIVNALLGKAAAGLFALLHIRPANPRYPIPNFFAMELVVFLFAIVFFLWLKARISADRPGATQQCMEMFLTNSMGVGVKDLLDDIAGHGTERHIPLMGAIGMFILLSNLAALVPGFMSPTAEVTVPLGCAVVVFLYYNWFGFGKHGALGYAKTLMGPVIFIAPIMVVVETFSHFARMLSLTVRLWANMMVSELIYVSFLGLSITFFSFLGHLNPAGYLSVVVPVGVPLALSLFHIFEAVLQAFIFTILAIVYLGLATAEEH
ncbi:MAG TPA: FoF1 ATP synthase subunit a [Candidatus Acidoferrales bacterium]|nr:FoF1 ATP synthase subunit a [Candidatus Acidoferrales bacterium]